MQLRAIAVVLVTLAPVLACGPAGGGPQQPTRPGVPTPSRKIVEAEAEDFRKIQAGFLEWYFESHPVRASELGVHAYDARLPALDRTGIQQRIEGLLEWLDDLERIRFDLLEGPGRYDFAIMEYAIRNELLELEEARSWANDPGYYTDIVARGLAAVVEREYAPLEERAPALVARMTAAAAMLPTIRVNLERPPRLWTELAVASVGNLIEYLERDVPALWQEQTTGGLPAGLEAARRRLVVALTEHAEWLGSDLMARSTGTFRLGRYLFQRKLLYGEHVGLELAELERLNRTAISDYRQRLETVAREIDPDRSPRAILDSIGAHHPPQEELVTAAREMVVAAREWTRESGLVPLADERIPEVRTTPPIARGEFSSLRAPGPFEPDSTLLPFLYVTGVRPEWDQEQRQEHLVHLSYADLMVIALHEAFPGAWVQQQHVRQYTPMRRAFPASTFETGWAHYAAELALEEGVTDDPGVRLAYLRRALQRHARWHAVIRIHARDEPLEQVVRSFMEIAYFDEITARREVIRATRTPTALTDALGRLQIKDLRRDYRAHVEEDGGTFDPAEFHTRLLQRGVPAPLARDAFMPERRRERRDR